MKKTLAAALTLLRATSVFAFDNDDSIVRWRSIVGVITAPAVHNPVGSIHGGAGPWSVRSGRASVDLVLGHVSFDVEGLVLNGGTASRTPGPVSEVTGTLVCNAGTQTQAILETAIVTLNVHGDAHFSGHLQSLASLAFFLARGAATVHTCGFRHQNWTESVTGGSRVQTLVRLFSRLCAEHS